MTCINKVIVSTNDNPIFYNLWELIYKSWKLYFPEVDVVLAFVTNRSEDDQVVKHLSQWGTVKLYPEIPNIPTSNLSKVVRLIEATKYGKEVCVVNDIDLVPLQSEYFLNRLELREPNKLLSIGRLTEWENLRGIKKYENKCPMGYTTGESFIWKQIINPDNLDYQDLINSWRGLCILDEQEAIDNPPADGVIPNGFCDESLLRALRTKAPELSQIVSLGFNPKVDGIDRSWWDKLDINRLYNNEYVEAHLPRLQPEHFEKIMTIVDYIKKVSNDKNITFRRKL